jgi:pimeloyl-ACP methyl ester carboxylesterase
MARFLLVHGAWHGGWCFAEVAAALRERGHSVDAPDLPCDQVGLTAHDYAALLPAGADLVVGHSLGARTAALVDARRRVYLAGVLPVAAEDSHGMFAPGFDGIARDELGRSYWPDADTCARRMYPECTRELSDWAFPQLRRQATLPWEAPALASDDVVIVTTRDAAVAPAWQRRTARAHGAQTIELDSGHSPFFTQPVELAGLLHSLA